MNLHRVELSDVLNAVVKTCIWISSVPYTLAFEEATVMLHYKCPVDPHRTCSLNSLGNVQQGMDRDWACRYPGWVVLVKNSATCWD